MKPVTELYEAAESAYRGAGDRRLGEAVLKFDIDMGDEHEPNRDMLEVLDLVATLPPERLEEVRRCVEGDGEKRWRAALGPWNDDAVSVETCLGLMRRTPDAYKGLPQITSPQLGLVRWVAGLSDADLQVVRWALASGAGEAKAGGRDGDGERLGKMLTGLHDALSGGEGEAKCPECHGAGKVKRLEGGGSIRVVKYDPCPKCAEGEGGAKEEDTTPREPGCQCHIEEGDSPCRVHGEDEGQPPHPMWVAVASAVVKPGPTILPAGKPPPFLRVGMVLAHGGLELELIEHGAEYRVPSWRCWSGLRGDKKGRRLAWWPTSWLEKMPLAEPFTVEGEA